MINILIRKIKVYIWLTGFFTSKIPFSRQFWPIFVYTSHFVITIRPIFVPFCVHNPLCVHIKKIVFKFCVHIKHHF